MKNLLKDNLFAIAALTTAVLLTAAAVKSSAAEPAGVRSKADSDKVARGKYIVTVAGCNDCHTPWTLGPNGPEPDMTRMLSGHPEGLVMPPAPRPASPWQTTAAVTNTAWAGPWGVSFTANLTPDPETGLGKWTLRNFVDTIRTGRHMGRGRAILPPMPIPMHKHFTDADLESIFSYLQSIPPVKNRVPEPVAPVELSQAPKQ
jgi:mono/diheme cytochrome c family protein